MDHNLIQTLKAVGLNDNEAKTYLCLLGLGPQSVSTIAKKTRLNRSSCYITMERLMQKGFVEKVIQENNSPFRAVEPMYVLDQLKNNHYDLESKIDNLGMALKDFDQLQKGYEGKPKVIFFQDENGFRNALENTFTSTEPLRCYASLEELSDFMTDYMPHYYQKRVQQGLRVRAIYPATEKSFRHKMRDKAELRESRLVPVDYDFHLDVMIYDHKVVITSLKEKFGIVIESKDMAEAQKKIFDLVWTSNELYDRKITEKFRKELGIIAEQQKK